MKTLLASLLVSAAVALGAVDRVEAADAKEAAHAPQILMYDIAHSILKVELAPGVTPDAAVRAMLSKAAETI